MEKKLSRRALYKLIGERLKAKEPKSAIFHELSPSQGERRVAVMIANYPDFELVPKYRMLNRLLVGLLLLLGASRVALFGSEILSQSPELAPIALFALILPVGFAIEIGKYRGYAYNILGIFCVAAVLRTAGDLGAAADLAPIACFGVVATFVLAIAIAILAFFLARRLFPDLGLFGARKNRDTGTYRLQTR